MSFTVEVTQSHIDRGIAKDSCECPVALAVKELFPEVKIEVGVGALEVWSVLETWSPSYMLSHKWPKRVQEWIREFDDCGDKEPEPFSFELEIASAL